MIDGVFGRYPIAGGFGERVPYAEGALGRAHLAVREAGDKWLRATEQIDRMQKVYYKALSAFHKEQGKRQARAVFPLEPRSRASSSP